MKPTLRPLFHREPVIHETEESTDAEKDAAWTRVCTAIAESALAIVTASRANKSAVTMVDTGSQYDLQDAIMDLATWQEELEGPLDDLEMPYGDFSYIREILDEYGQISERMCACDTYEEDEETENVHCNDCIARMRVLEKDLLEATSALLN